MNKILLYPLNKVSYNTFKNKNLLHEECLGILDFNGEDNKLINMMKRDNIYEKYEYIEFDKLYIYDNLIGDIHIREIYEKNNVLEESINLIKYCNEKNIEVIVTIYSNDIANIIDENNLDVTYKITKDLEYQELKKYEKINNRSLNIGVFATDSCTGKFTTQLLLNNIIRTVGKTEMILTEPNGFQLSKYYAPVNDYLTYTEFIDYVGLLQQKIYSIEKTEFIIFAGQSGINFKYKNSPVYFELQSLSLLYLLSSKSDVIYLVYKPFDIENLRKSIEIINVFCKVIQIIIVIPDSYEQNHLKNKELNKYIKINDEDVYMMKKEIAEKIGDFPVVKIGELHYSLDVIEFAKNLKPVFNEGKIKVYSKNKKKEILRYIISKFKYEYTYTEKLVNKIIIQNIEFQDYALIRRELIDNKLLYRSSDGSNYKRI